MNPENSTDDQGNLMKRFLSEEQDPKIVEKVLSKISGLLTSSEDIAYIAVQKPLISISPQAVVLTDRRFIVYHATLTGSASFKDYLWRDLEDAQLKEGMIRATLTLQTIAGEELIVEHLPKEQARKLYAYAQEKEEKVLEERRQREMEEKRAEAGGVVVQYPEKTESQAMPSESTGDPLENLKKLKEMSDAGLISSEDYEEKKAEILSRL